MGDSASRGAGVLPTNRDAATPGGRAVRFRRAYVVAIEPASTAPAWGATRAAQNGGHLLHLPPHEARRAWIELEVSGT